MNEKTRLNVAKNQEWLVSKQKLWSHIHNPEQLPYAIDFQTLLQMRRAEQADALSDRSSLIKYIKAYSGASHSQIARSMAWTFTPHYIKLLKQKKGNLSRRLAMRSLAYFGIRFDDFDYFKDRIAAITDAGEPWEIHPRKEPVQ